MVLKSRPFRNLLFVFVIANNKHFADQVADLGDGLATDLNVRQTLKLDSVDELFDFYFFGIILVVILR